MSSPRAATSVQMRKRTSPLLNASRLRRRSSMERPPASATQLYGFSTPFSIGPRNPRPPPAAVKKASRLSTSKLVRQKMMHCVILCSSMSCLRRCGLMRLIASLLASGVVAGPAGTLSRLWMLSVLGFGSSLCQSGCALGSTLTMTWCTVSGTLSLPFRSTHVGVWQILALRSLISGAWSVALNMSTCRRYVPVPALGKRWKSFMMASWFPVSSKRSASSSTKKRTSERSSLPLSTKSMTRPGVPVTMSTPSRSARICAPASTPPTKSEDSSFG
mmetsp:Transcript_27592/g.90258  ORF Transcript_27592/g.90258 Transcript_27592/m.90258 type:complete len:274 (+) Transcript_27592:602-1423(+)